MTVCTLLPSLKIANPMNTFFVLYEINQNTDLFNQPLQILIRAIIIITDSYWSRHSHFPCMTIEFSCKTGSNKTLNFNIECEEDKCKYNVTVLRHKSAFSKYYNQILSLYFWRSHKLSSLITRYCFWYVSQQKRRFPGCFILVS